MDHDVQTTDGNAAAEVRRVAVKTQQPATISPQQTRESAAEREVLIATVLERWRSHEVLVGEIWEHTERLRDAVREFALMACAQEMPPERMLIELKETIRGAIHSRGREAQELMEDVVRWSIDAYYEKPQALE